MVTALVYQQEVASPLMTSLGLLWGILLIFNHLLPRIVAHSSPERVAQTLLPPMLLISGILGPVGNFVTWVVAGRTPEAPEKDDDERREELEALLSASQESGLIAQEDANLVSSLVDFGDSILREVMTPRVDLICAPAEATVAELADSFVKEGLARMPVYSERPDNIEGFVHVKDVLAALRAGHDSQTARQLAKPVAFEPETKKVAQTLRELQQAKRQMAMCIDEYGSISGLVTIEDLLEEIVGDIQDEYDQEPPHIVPEPDGAYLVAGKAPLEVIQEELGIHVDNEDFETVSGLVLFEMGRIPLQGEHLDFQGYRFEIVDADRRRIKKLRLRQSPEFHRELNPGPVRSVDRVTPPRRESRLPRDRSAPRSVVRCPGPPRTASCPRTCRCAPSEPDGSRSRWTAPWSSR